jgi:hypothetical protein
MVTLSRKTANENPASTAALRRVEISLSTQRRALRHPAGALMKKSSAAEMSSKRIREEVMNGTFAQWTANSRTKTVVKGIVGGILAAMLAVAAHSAPITGAARAERAVDETRPVDRAKIETLQRWVSAGHEEWCKDARLVAMDELRRVAPTFAGDAADLEAVPMDEDSIDGSKAEFSWSSPDGRATYRVKVEKFDWLLPIAGDEDAIVWVPTHVEVVSHR